MDSTSNNNDNSIHNQSGTDNNDVDEYIYWTEENLQNTIEKIESKRKELESLSDKVRNLRVAAVTNLMDLGLLYDPEIRVSLSEVYQKAKEVKENIAFPVNSKLNYPHTNEISDNNPKGDVCPEIQIGPAE